MNIYGNYRRKARIIEREIDTSMYVPGERENYYGRYEDLPIIFVVAVQVKHWFGWVTIWEASTDITDSDSREVVRNQAKELYQKWIAV